MTYEVILFVEVILYILIQWNGWQDVRTKALNDLMLLKKNLMRMFSLKNISKTKFLPMSLRSVSDYHIEDLVIHNCGNPSNAYHPCASIEKVASFKCLVVVFDK